MQILVDTAVFLVVPVVEYRDDKLDASWQLRRKPARAIGSDLIERIEEDDHGLGEGLKQRPDLIGEFVGIVLQRTGLRSGAAVNQLLDQRHEHRAEIRGCGAGTDEAVDDRRSLGFVGPGDGLGHQRRFAGT